MHAQTFSQSYASLIYLTTSLKAGLLPYMRRNTRNILAASHIMNTTEPARMIRLSAICHADIAPEASLIMEVMGLVRGKKVRVLDTAPSGLLTMK
jgi:Fe2+ transport system protein FeoA